MLRRGFLFLILALAPAPVVAQESYDARQAALSGLSGIFGELHHIRRLCEPAAEGDAWRNRMKRLIDLEQPSFDLREQMVAAFNNGYRAAQERFFQCDGSAQDYAAARATAGDALVSNLTAPLYAAERGEDDADVAIFRGAEPQ